MLLRILAKFKGLRGTWADPFGYTLERRTERQLRDEYFELMSEIGGLLTPANYFIALELASLPDEIRGYGHVKDANVARFAARRRELLEQFPKVELDWNMKAEVAPRATIPT